MWHPILVQFYQLLERREKEFRVNRRDAQPDGRAIKAVDIAVWPKEQNFIVRRTIGLESFKDSLSIVEADGAGSSDRGPYGTIRGLDQPVSATPSRRNI